MALEGPVKKDRKDRERTEIRSADASPWTPFEDRRRARDEKRDAVLRMAVRLFLEEGYHRTPLARIAERLNITKPALYNYFASKEEILYALYRFGDEQYEDSFGRIERGDGNGLVQTPRNDPRLRPHHDDGFRHVLRPSRRPRARRGASRASSPFQAPL